MTHISTSTRIGNDPSPACRAIAWRLGRRRMTRSQIAEPHYTLAGISIFSALPPNVLQTVHRSCSWRRYEQGELIVDYLDASDDVFFVAAGDVCVTIHSLAGKAVSFRNLGAGEMFGEYAAIDGESRSASVEARRSSRSPSAARRSRRHPLVHAFSRADLHVADGMIGVGLGVTLPHVDGMGHQLAHGGLEIIVADDAAGDAGKRRRRSTFLSMTRMSAPEPLPVAFSIWARWRAVLSP